MSVSRPAGEVAAGYAAFALLVVCTLLALGVADAALAQFGVARGPTPPAADGFSGWILAKQAEFYRAMSATIRAAKTDGSAAFTLFGISFLYGIFHAAGPGHGKAVISSYLVANDETWRRGIVLSFASALLQALTAILLVGIAAVLLGATAKMMGDAVRVIEIVSYGLIAAVGARLSWVKGRAFVGAWRGQPAAHAHHRAHPPHDDHSDHSHGPEPRQLAGRGGWRRGLSAIVAVGLRPCSGAILVLVFTLAQGLFWLGVGATFLMGLGTAVTVAAIATLAVGARGLAGRLARAKPGAGMLALRGLETAAAALVLAFGLLLLTGYLASERLLGF
jgi:ABC-type nickel/cobalt efflux system permease component RcnA